MRGAIYHVMSRGDGGEVVFKDDEDRHGLEDWFQKGLTQHGVICEPITLAIAHAAEMLPPIHNDSADRFILARAKVLHVRIAESASDKVDVPCRKG